MTRERAKELAPIIAAYGEEKTIQVYGDEGIWYSIENPSFDLTSPYRIKPEPKMRPMTRDELLRFVTTTPGVVVRQYSGLVCPGQCHSFNNPDLGTYEWAQFQTDGTLGPWHKFEVEE